MHVAEVTAFREPRKLTVASHPTLCTWANHRSVSRKCDATNKTTLQVWSIPQIHIQQTCFCRSVSHIVLHRNMSVCFTSSRACFELQHGRCGQNTAPGTH